MIIITIYNNNNFNNNNNNDNNNNRNDQNDDDNIYIYNNNKVRTLEYQQEKWKNITNRWQKRINNGMQPVKCQLQADAINDGQLTIVRIVSLGARIPSGNLT